MQHTQLSSADLPCLLLPAASCLPPAACRGPRREKKKAACLTVATRTHTHASSVLYCTLPFQPQSFVIRRVLSKASSTSLALSICAPQSGCLGIWLPTILTHPDNASNQASRLRLRSLPRPALLFLFLGLFSAWSRCAVTWSISARSCRCRSSPLQRASRTGQVTCWLKPTTVTNQQSPGLLCRRVRKDSLAHLSKGESDVGQISQSPLPP